MIEKIKNSPLNLQSTSVYNFNEFSLTELLNKFFMSINACIDSSNQALNFLVWLKGEGLPQETIKELNNMYVDGRLTKIIDDMSGNLTDKINEFNEELNIKVNNFNEELNNELDKNNLSMTLIENNTNTRAYNVKFPPKPLLKANGDGVNDDTQIINTIIKHCDSNGGGIVFLPSGKYLINGTIEVPRSVSLVGTGKQFGNVGTRLWRNEGSDIKSPFLTVGSGEGTANGTLIKISGFTIVGDSTVSDVVGIDTKSIGIHGLEISDIHYTCFAGVPIKLKSESDTSRVQFCKISGIDVGFDWGVYKQEVVTKTNNNICGGIWLQGVIDGIYIENCRFTHYTSSSDLVGDLTIKETCGIRIERINENIKPLNNIEIKNCFFRGFKHAIYTEAMNTLITNNYIEHSFNGITIKKYVVSSDFPITAQVNENYFSGVQHCLNIVDDRTTENSLKINVNFESNYLRRVVFEKLYAVNSNSINARVLLLSNALPTIYNSTIFEVYTSTTPQNTLYGQILANSESYKFNLINPTIHSIASQGKNGYTIQPNATSNADYGLDLKNSEDLKLMTCAKNGTTIYRYDNENVRTEVMKQVNDKIEFPLNIILRGSGGKRYNVYVDDSGNIATQLITNS